MHDEMGVSEPKPRASDDPFPAGSALSSGAENERAYREYRSELLDGRVTTAARSAIVMGVVIQNLFLLLDYYAFPALFHEFFVTRMTINLAFLLCYVTAGTTPRAAMIGAAYALGLGMLALIYRDGATTTAYYTGLVLVFFGVGVMMPMSAVEALVVSGSMAAVFAAIPLIDSAALSETYWLQTFFVLGASAEMVFCCAFLDRMRFRDYCQRQQLIEAESHLREMDRAKSRFSANVHHELRTPLTLILSPLDALRSGEFGSLPPQIASTLETMHSNGRRLHKMINNLLDLSKLESEQFKVVRRPTRVEKLVLDLVTGARPMAERKGVELEFRGEDPDREIAIDPDAIEKVVINLIGNALKFTDPGGRIDVTIEAEGDGVGIAVKDSGIGIPPEKLDSIFDRFAQVDSSATRSYEGTGIGLSLAQEMVQLHEGRIWAESEGEGHGTTMRVWLPTGLSDLAIEEDVLADDEGRQLNARASLEALGTDFNLEGEDDDADDGHDLDQIARQLERAGDAEVDPEDEALGLVGGPAAEILITEDNPDMRNLLKTLIGRKYRVRTARNGREALERIAERKPDLILSDVMMPEMDGTELCRRVKGDPETSTIPIVLVTSKAESEMKVEGLELGADDYVTKPFHPRELLARVGSLVRSSVLRKELALRNGQLTETLEELKRAEVRLVQSERLAAVGEIAAGIAHEVNNPVNFALNAARMLIRNAEELDALARSIDADLAKSEAGSREENDLNELVRDVVDLSEIVVEGLERTNALVSDLKNLASHGQEEGRVQRPIPMSGCVEKAMKLIAPTLTESNVEATVEIEDDTVAIVGDEGALGQVLLNLLGNACDAMKPEGGELHVCLSRAADEVIVSIRDTGPGIPDDVRDQIFTPFFTTKPTGEGTGLGLAVSRQIVLDHGGTLEVESEPGVGTTFVVVLPEAGARERSSTEAT